MSRIAYLESKVVEIEDAMRRILTWKMKGHKVVFTNGCFDILHKGHVTYLAKATEYGNRLVVGLNSDASVKRQQKGGKRPINDESARAAVLAALSSVDLVILFDEDTPQQLIETLEPNVVAKGADYNPKQNNPSEKDYIVGKQFMDKTNGEVVAIPLVKGFSSTSIIEKAKK